MALPDFAFATLLNSPGAGATPFILSTGQGARFPDPATVGSYMAFTRPNTSTPSIPTNTEKVLVTAKSGDTFTVTRAYDNSTLVFAAAGDQFFLGPSSNEIDARIPPFYIPAAQFASLQAGPVLTLRGAGATLDYKMLAWNFDPSAILYVGTVVEMPARFVGKTVTLKYHYALSTAGAGDWVALSQIGYMAVTQDVDKSADAAHSPVVLAGPTANKLAVTGVGTFVPTTALIRLACGRYGTNASDTYASDVWFIGAELSIA